MSTIIIIIIAIIGTPLFAVIAATAIIGFIGTGTPLTVVAQEIAGITDMQLLYTIPLFAFAGYVLAHSNTSKRLVRLTKAAIGFLPGGLAIVTLLTCALFTAFTGASGVTIIALGGFLLPSLLSERYNEKFSYGLITTAGSVGLLFPPSLPIIMFGVVSQASIDKMFIAGILPGIVIILVFAIYSFLISKRDKVETTKFSFKELLSSLWEMKFEIPLPILLFVGIYSGRLAISDAAAFTALYIVIVEIFIQKDIKIKQLPLIIKESMVLVGAILIILSCSRATSNLLIEQEIPQKLFSIIEGVISSKLVFLIVLNIFLLIVGCIMDIYSALMIVVPLILPIAKAYNIDLIHLGIIFLTNLEIGYLTPPVGMNLFISSLRFNRSIIDIYKYVVIFIGLSFISLILITYIPNLSLWFIEKPSIVGKWELIRDDGSIDNITLESNNIYTRLNGNSQLEIMMNEPMVGKYIIYKNYITLYNNVLENGEKYRYEIYESGKKLLFIQENQKQKPIKIFYENKIDPPFTVNQGLLIGRWVSDNGDLLEFDFNGYLNVLKNSEESSFIYRVNRNKILLESDEENEFSYILKYRFKDNNRLIIKDKNGETIYKRVSE